MFRYIRLCALLCCMYTPVALANDYVVHVNGIVCEFCAYGVAKKVSKLEFIDRARLNKGVVVDAENQKVIVAVREDIKLDKDALFEAIIDAGYDPISIEPLSESADPS